MPRLNALMQTAEEKIARQPTLGRFGGKVSSTLHRGVLRGGEPTRQIADFFHGKWLGHSLHGAITDLTVGAWSMAFVFDLMGLAQRSSDWERTSDALTQIGILTSVPTALAGAADYSTVDQNALSSGALHAMANSTALGLYIGSLIARRKGRRALGVSLSSVAFGIAFFSAWLGGELVYRHQIGVDHADRFDPTDEWTAVLRAKDLEEGKPRCATYREKKVLLFRQGDRIQAIGAVCSHAGGPLEEGRFVNGTVECPWHQSVFNLSDGFVVHGPATNPQQSFDARIRGEQIEIRPRPLEIDSTQAA